jgi:hypothetical protein
VKNSRRAVSSRPEPRSWDSFVRAVSISEAGRRLGH